MQLDNKVNSIANTKKMKRAKEDKQSNHDLAKCLMLLSKVGRNESSSSSSRDVFVCKTCKREFSSFQALGGHRAAHKKPKKLIPGCSAAASFLYLAEPHEPWSRVNSKKHECPICGMEFAFGQALGGHMRRHKDVMSSASLEKAKATPPSPVLKKSSSSKRVSCMNLDLNLAPPDHQPLISLIQSSLS